MALGAGATFLQQITPAAVAEHERALADRLCEQLSALRGLHLYRGGTGGVLSFTHECLSADLLTAALDRRGICVRGGLHCAPLAHSVLGTEEGGTVRISLCYFNTANEIDRFVKELSAILPRQ